MDGWKYVSASGRKESGFENLKTRFQDCNLSRKQENKRDGMIERKQPFNRESKLSAKMAVRLCGKIENEEERKEASKKEVIPSFVLSTWNESKPSVHRYGWKAIKMYHNNSVLQ